MSPEDIKELIDGLPLKKRATTRELILLAFAVILLLAFGAYLEKRVQSYFDGFHAELLTAISKASDDQAGKITTIGQKLEANSSTIDANTREIEGIHTYYWKNSDQQRYMQLFDRANRQTVPALVIPEVPQPVLPH